MNSFLQGKKTLTAAPLRPLSPLGNATIAGPAKPAAKTPARPHAETDQPTVEVIKEGDKVVRLIVVCACGQRTEIECLYPGR